MYTKGYCNIEDSQKIKQTDFDVRKAYMETCVKGSLCLFVVGDSILSLTLFSLSTLLFSQQSLFLQNMSELPICKDYSH